MYELEGRAWGVVRKAKSFEDVSFQINANKHQHIHTKRTTLNRKHIKLDLFREKSWSDDSTHREG